MKSQFRKMLIVLSLVGMTSLAQPVSAQLLKDEIPASAQSIDVEDRVGEFLPLGLVFKDDKGRPVGLGKYFKQAKPIVLTLNYSDCPGLCVAQLDMLVETLRGLNGGGIGEDFEVVTVSIDPRESWEKAGRTKLKYTGLLMGTQAERGWHFLTGEQSQIAQLADAVGFRYSYDRVNDRFNHAAVTYFVSSDGRICRYFLSLGSEPDQFKLAIAEAAEGKLTRSLADAFIQMCYMYDPDSNRYTASARRMMAFGGAAFCMLLLGFTAPFWFAQRPRSDQPVGAANGLATHFEGCQTDAETYNNSQSKSSETTEIVKQ